MKSLAAPLLFALALLLPPLAPLARGQSAKFTTLYQFSPLDGNGGNADGFLPNGGLVQGTDGNFYGTASNGGPYGKGTAFKITPGGTLIVLQRFGNNNGAQPRAGLLLASDGNFYGTTNGGGTYGKGTIFKLTASGLRTTLYSFAGKSTGDGARPGTRLFEDKDGNFYGTTLNGGTGDHGVVYQMTPGGTVRVLHSFLTSDGAGYPGVEAAPVIMGSDGNLYGATYDYGQRGQGYLYRLTTDGAFDILHEYQHDNIQSALVEVTPGVFYGTTFYSLFKFTSEGELSTVPIDSTSVPGGLRTFVGSPLLASDGKLYGVANSNSGTPQQALIYSVRPDGSDFTDLYQGFTGANDNFPEGPLVQGRNGSFYGATHQGGNDDGQLGTIFNVAVPPTITSPATAMGMVGQPFSYQISGSLVPTHFGALGLPAGLKVDAKTGLITGTPGKALTKTLTLQATNTGGTGTGMLKLSITN